MNDLHHRRLRHTLAALALSAASAAQADLTPMADTRVFDLAPFTVRSDEAVSEPSATDARRYALAVETAAPAPPTTLWAFITSARAQQRADVFERLESNLVLLQTVDSPAAVPLPGAVWLLLMGLLGLAGLRLHRPATASSGPFAATTPMPSAA